MKKIFLLLFVLFYACSSSNDEPNCFEYTARIETKCGDNTTSMSYEISEKEYNYLISQMSGNSACVSVTFKDINGVSRSGYIRDASKIGC